MVVSAIMVGAQILIVFVGGAAFSVVPLNGAQWGISLVIGILTLPIGAAIRLLPDWPFEQLWRALEAGTRKLTFWRRAPAETIR